MDVVLTESGHGNPRLYLFEQQPDHTFDAVTLTSGLWEVNEDGASPGYVTPLDFDRDGDEDLIVTTSGNVRLYRNDIGNANHWLAIDLRGVGAPGYANASAIGAKVEVVTGTVDDAPLLHGGHVLPTFPDALGHRRARCEDPIRLALEHQLFGERA